MEFVVWFEYFVKNIVYDLDILVLCMYNIMIMMCYVMLSLCFDYISMCVDNLF